MADVTLESVDQKLTMLLEAHARTGAPACCCRCHTAHRRTTALGAH
jgi:hypothetical protein